MMRRPRWIRALSGLFAAGALVLAAPDSGPSWAKDQEVVGRLLAIAPDDVDVETPTYRIGKEDVLRVTVWGEEDLSQESLPVRPDGKISLPLLGDVLAAGRTPEELSRVLVEMYTEKVRAPEVTVMVTEVNSFKVFLTGRVNNPGVLKFGRETTLLQALALAGGFADFAQTKKILVIREVQDGTQRIQVNYEKIISGANLEMNLKLKPGDTIVVP